MNTCTTAFKNMIVFIKNNVFAFAVLMIGLVVSAITLLYLSVRIDYYEAVRNSSTLDFSQVFIENNVSATVSELRDQLLEYQNKNSNITQIYCKVPVYSAGINEEYFICDLTKDNIILNQAKNNNDMESGTFFSDDDLTNGNNVCVLSGVYDFKSKTVDCGSFELDVIGNLNQSSVDKGYIPYETLAKNNYIPDKVYLSFGDKDLAVVLMKNYVSDMEKEFPDWVVQTNVDDLASDKSDIFTSENKAMIAMILVAVFNVAYLYIFVLQKRLKTIYIYKITGATNAKIFRIFSIEFFYLLIVQMVVSISVFKFIVVPIISKYDLVFGYGVSIKHYIFACAVMLILCILFVFPPMLFYIRKNAIEIKQYIKG